MSSALIGCHGFWHASDHSHHDGYVLTGVSEVWEAIVVLDDPPMYVMGHGTCMPTIRVVSDLALELCLLLLQLEPRVLELLLLRPQLLHARGPYVPLGLVVLAIQGSGFPTVDTFIVHIVDSHHEALA